MKTKDIKAMAIKKATCEAMIAGNRKYIRELSDGYARMKVGFFTFVCPALYIAYTYMVDTVDILEDRGLLKFTVKKEAKRAMDYYGIHDKEVKRLMTEAEDSRENSLLRLNLVTDLGIRMAALCQEAVDNLEDKLGKVLVKNAVEGDTELLARIATSQVLLGMAQDLYGNYMKMSVDKFTGGRDMSVHFRASDPGKLIGHWKTVCDGVARVPYDLDFEKDYNARRAYNRLYRMVSDYKVTNRASRVAMGYEEKLKTLLKEERKKKSEQSKNK